MIDRATFFAAVRASGGARRPLMPRSVQSLEAILDCWEARYPRADLREVSYSMATARHEAWDPKASQIDYAIEEIGGSRKPYGQPHPRTGKRYYGRGLTQTTHIENYERVGKAVGVDCVAKPELLLRPDISAASLVCGMVLGWYREGGRGRRIGHYFNGQIDDPVGARGIINGDVAKNGARVAAHHRLFLDALRMAREPASVTSGSKVVTPPPKGVTSSDPVQPAPKGGFFSGLATALRRAFPKETA
jgi:putative chitinase